MNLFGGYGSDSDGEEVAAAPVPEIPKPVILNNTKPTQSVQRKVKRLDISFLPPEIQAALTRGDSTNDSDDEGPGYVAGRRNDSSAAPAKTGDAGTKSKLLGMLPAPKGKEEPKLEPKVAQETKVLEQTTTEQPEAPLKSKFVFGYASTSTSRVSTKANDVPQQKAGGATSSSYNEEDVPVLPWLQSSSSKSSWVAQERVTPFASAPPLPKPSVAPFAPPTVAASLAPAGPPAPTLAQAQPQAQPQQLSYEEYMRQQALLQQQHGYYGPSADEAQSSAGRKRKEREIELQLLAGDLSGLDQQSGAVKEITVDHDWNEFAYTEQQQRQLEVQRGFGLGGTNKMLTQVSKQQNRKHQLSSLAMKAAETELALLEKRGARNLTKTETQGKYGW